MDRAPNFRLRREATPARTPGTPVISKVHYVYIIESLSKHGQYYIGFTDDLDDRLKHHNGGAVPSTAPYGPWVYRTCLAFADGLGLTSAS